MAIAPKKTAPATAPEVVRFQPSGVEMPAPKAAAVFESIAAPAREMQENMRKAAEKGIEETRAAYARVKTAAEEATESLETSYSTAYRGFAELNAKAADAMRANAEAGFGLFKSLASAKSLPEAIELQTEHTRKHIEALNFQGKEFAALAQKITSDAVAPLKAMADKAMAMPR